METKQICYNCKHCKIWYDEDSYTMRMSCMQKSKRGKTITWKSYPLYLTRNGAIIPTDDTIDSITEEFIDYSKRRLSPKWCKFRNSKIERK